jgi:hypothetical protein
MFYGEEGEDYTILNNGRLQPLNRKREQEVIRHILLSFRNTDLEPVLYNAPSNFESEMILLSQRPVITISDADTEAVITARENITTNSGNLEYSYFSRLNIKMGELGRNDTERYFHEFMQRRAPFYTLYTSTVQAAFNNATGQREE